VTRPMVGKWIDTGKIPADALVQEDGKEKIDPVAADIALGGTRERVRAVDPEDETFGSNANARGGRGAGGEATLTRITAIERLTKTENWRHDLEVKKGLVRKVTDIQDAGAKCGEAVVRVLEDKKLRVEEMVSAATKEGATGLRRLLNEIIFAERGAIMKAFGELVAAEQTPAEQGQSDERKAVGY